MTDISIVLPTYNRAGTIGRPIESIQAQDFKDFELIVVDDGSTDHTRERVASYTDTRIVYLCQDTNLGGNAARNRGIAEAKGKIVCFIDSDDAFLPHKLSYVHDYFDTHPGRDVLVDSFEILYPPGMGKKAKRRINPVIDNSADLELAIFARHLYKATPALSARRKALIAVGLFDESLKRRQDMDLLLRLARQTTCASTDAVLWTKYWSEDAISSKLNTFVDATLEICERHPDYLWRPEFRAGLSRDVARHAVRLLRRGDWATLRVDFGRLAAQFGATDTARLLVRGLVEIGKRRKLPGQH
jgi:glycosyltransferase involved in cell wall biosynthesis